jgi:hypothetical protein
MSKQIKKMPEWIEESRGYRLLIGAAEAAFNGNCTCECCRLIQEWALTTKPPVKPLPKEARAHG